MKSLRTLLILGLASLPLPAATQARDLRFERISIDQGLSQNTVHTIIQDRLGFLWIGTDDGLNRYDGYRFEVLRSGPGDPGGLSHNRVRALCEDSDGMLWIGTRNGGLNRYDRRSRAFTRYRHDPKVPESLASDVVWTILQDRRGTLWVGTSRGLDRIEPRRARSFIHLRHDPDDPESLSHNVVRALLEDRAGNLWVGTKRGLDRVSAGPPQADRLDAQTRSLTRFLPRPEGDDGGYNSIGAIHEDRRGRLWLGTWDGLMQFDPATTSFVFYGTDSNQPEDLEHSIQDIHQDSDGTLWLATEGLGVLLFDPRTETLLSRVAHEPLRASSLSGDKVKVFFQDRSGAFWVGTSAGGLNKLDAAAKAFVHYRSDPAVPEGLSGDMITAIWEDRDDSLWIGTRRSGLNRIAPGPPPADRVAVEHFRADPEDPTRLARDDVRAVLRDSAGVLWVGAEAGGLHRLDGGVFTRYRHDPHDPASLRDNDVWVLYEDSSRNLWVGTYGGSLSRYDPGTDAFHHYPHDPDDPASLASNIVRAIHQDSDGGLWIGTHDGLDRWAGAPTFEAPGPPAGGQTEQRPGGGQTGRFRHHRHDPRDPSSLSSNEVLSILEDRAGTLWVGTHGGGLNRLVPGPKGATFRFYTEQDGLPSNVVYGILEDRRGRLWMSTNRGLSRFDPRTESFRNYDVTDGLQNNEFNAGAHFRSRRGEMFFGGLHGFNAFYPEEIEDNPYVPPVVLTSFRKFNREVTLAIDTALLQTVTLRHHESVFSFGFAALSYTAQHKNQYAYRLAGFRDPWTQLGTRRDVTFTNLDPGAYTLEVRASNNDGVWNREGLALEVIVEPPFWRTWWFTILMVLAFGGLLWAGYLVRTRSIRQHNRALAAENAERRRAEAELAANNAELEVRNAEMERFVYTVSHDLTTPLVTIKGFLGFLKRDVARAATDPAAGERAIADVARIGGAADTMHHLLEDLLELSRIGRLINPPESVALSELAEEAVALVGRIDQRGVTVDVDPAMPGAHGDRLRLLEVYQNLIDNAVKFLGEQPSPRIEIGAREDSGEVLCWVRDNGLGIDPRYLEKVFGLFERLDQRIPGTGVGLALVKRIVEVHSGKCWVESEGVGRGCTFFFTLPPARG